MLRDFVTVLFLAACIAIGFVGGNFAGGLGFNLFGIGTIESSAQGVIDANSGAIETNKHALDIIDRIRNSVGR